MTIDNEIKKRITEQINDLFSNEVLSYFTLENNLIIKSLSDEILSVSIKTTDSICTGATEKVVISPNLWYGEDILTPPPLQ